tara:strand:+ start:108 stop:428 length:321 start_codon:yes stop_codon:yes gene_type:complete
MAKITYIDHEGTERAIDVGNGISLMQGAINGGIPGIVAECGGACSCATCHVYIESDWTERVGGPGDAEREMLECAIDPLSNSRLGCQVKVSDELDGLIVRTPESQF